MIPIMKYASSAILLLVLCGCTSSSTVKFNSSITRNESCTNSAVISINREQDRMSGGTATGILDSDTIIGEIGPGGNLTWCRPPGYVAILSMPVFTERAEWNKPTHVVIFRAEAGKTYSFHTDFPLEYKRLFAVLEPENFDRKLINYEKYAEKEGFLTINIKPVPDELWKAELMKLTSQQGVNFDR